MQRGVVEPDARGRGENAEKPLNQMPGAEGLIQIFGAEGGGSGREPDAGRQLNQMPGAEEGELNQTP